STEWAHCKGSTPNYRGFPCSLWTLFHSLTVRQYELEMAKLKPFEQRFNLREVIDSVRFFVKHFFRCSECSKNFKKETYDYLDHLKKPQDAVLYLWKVHNSVNKRLANDITEDPVYPKDQFPSKTLCPDCYDNNNQWIEQRVFDFLVSFYSSKNMLPTIHHYLPEDKIFSGNLAKPRFKGQKAKSILDKFQPSTGLYIGIFFISVFGLMLLFIGIRKSRAIFGSR
ncbi:Sulfhydryl oxidase, partial [Brachionus plicatilis]